MEAKRIVDKFIDACDHVTNLRDDILIHRLRYSILSLGDERHDELLGKAGKALEK